MFTSRSIMKNIKV